MKFESDQIERIEEARPKIGPLIGVLRTRDAYWYRTSIFGLKKILQSGFIKPNDGRYPFTTGQSQLCMARDLGAVALFDFNTRPVDEILLRSVTWRRFFGDCGPATIAIKIDATVLNTKLIIPPGSLSDEEMRRYKADGIPYVPRYLPAVEAWHLGDVPVTAFKEYLVFRRNTGFYYERCDVDGGLERLCALNEDWQIAEEKADRDKDA